MLSDKKQNKKKKHTSIVELLKNKTDMLFRDLVLKRAMISNNTRALETLSPE